MVTSISPDLAEPKSDGRHSVQEDSKLQEFLRHRGWMILALPALLFLLVVFVIGFIGLVITSVQPSGDGSRFAVYFELFRSPSFHDALWRTLRLSFLTVIFSLLISYPVAYYIARSPESRRDGLLLLIIIPWMSSIVVRSFGWQIILGEQGPINEFLVFLGISGAPVPLVQNEFGILVGLVHVLSPFMILTLLSVLVSVDVRYEEAASLLGAGPWQLFTKVVFPLSRRGVATGCVLVFLMSNAVVVTPLMLGGVQSQTVATMMYTQLLELYNFQRGAALALVLVLLVVPPTLLMTWWGQRGQNSGGK